MTEQKYAELNLDKKVARRSANRIKSPVMGLHVVGKEILKKILLATSLNVKR
jgi:hypothetical protein